MPLVWRSGGAVVTARAANRGHFVWRFRGKARPCWEKGLVRLLHAPLWTSSSILYLHRPPAPGHLWNTKKKMDRPQTPTPPPLQDPTTLSLNLLESWFFFTNIDSPKPVLWWWPNGFILGVKIKNECLVANFPYFLGKNAKFLLKNVRKVDHILTHALVLGQFCIFWALQTCHELMLHPFWPTTFSIVLLWLQLDTICCDQSHWNGAQFVIVRTCAFHWRVAIGLEIFLSV